MTAKHLPQAVIVEKLLGIISRIVPKLPSDVLKQELTESLKEFQSAITPSVIYLDEVYEHAAKQNIQVNNEEAIAILENAAFDIDLNYAAKAVEYHVDEHRKTIDGD